MLTMNSECGVKKKKHKGGRREDSALAHGQEMCVEVAPDTQHGVTRFSRPPHHESSPSHCQPLTPTCLATKKIV